MAAQDLFDTLAGGFGHGVDRPGLNAFVANSQARNGLVTAQTQEAVNHAELQQEEAAARADLEKSLGTVTGDDGKPLLTPSAARLQANELIGHFGDAKTVMEAYRAAQAAHNTGILSDKSKLGTPDQTAAQQGLQSKVAEPVTLPNNFTTLAGTPPVVPQQSPEGVAQTADTNAKARLANTQADAGGFNPNTGARNLNLPPDQAAALDQAIKDGRLDPAKINSRTGPLWAAIEARNPGQINFNRLTADATLQRNAPFQQKAMVMEALPTMMSHMTDLGKQIGYSDNRTVGKMQQFMNGEFNDPTYAEYLPVRNDVLMNIAGVMRSVGMSDKAHQAEIEAAAPTMSPLALDGWLKGQMAALKPRLDQVRRVEHLGDQPNTPVGYGGGSNAPANGDLKSYTDEAAALAAGHQKGDRVIIGGVTGTLQ